VTSLVNQVSQAPAVCNVSLSFPILELWRFCTKDETRFNLQYVQVVLEGANITGVATDGHRLTKVTCLNPEPLPPDAPRVGMHFSAQDMKAMSKALKSFRGVPGVITDGKKAHVGNVSMNLAEYQGLFPDWQQVMPKADKKRVARYGINPLYVGDIGDYLKACGDKKLGIEHIGPSDDLGPVEFRASRPEFEATFIIMPMRM
jgi:hypothetical protein